MWFCSFGHLVEGNIRFFKQSRVARYKSLTVTVIFHFMLAVAGNGVKWGQGVWNHARAGRELCVGDIWWFDGVCVRWWVHDRLLDKLLIWGYRAPSKAGLTLPLYQNCWVANNCVALQRMFCRKTYRLYDWNIGERKCRWIVEFFLFFFYYRCVFISFLPKFFSWFRYQQVSVDGTYWW